MDGWSNGWMEGWVSEWMHQMGSSMDGWIRERLKSSGWCGGVASGVIKDAED